MNRKAIIQSIVIVICFGGAIIVIYNGFFKKTNSSISLPQSVTNTMTSNTTEAIPATTNNGPLPYGSDLQGELKRVLNKNNLQYEVFKYPVVDQAEVEIPVTDLVKPSPLPQTPKK